MKLNTIHREKVDYYLDDEADQLFIDGIQLGEIVSEYLDYDGKGLLNTLSCEIACEVDREDIWSLLNSDEGGKMAFPILMCSEGDLGCLGHIVLVEIKKEENCVLWLKFGIISLAKSSRNTIKKYQVYPRTVRSLKTNEIKWFESDKIFKFERFKYDNLMNYYRISNEERKIVECVVDWLHCLERGYKAKIPRKNLYLSVEMGEKKSIKLFGSNKRIDKYSEWHITAEYKPKYHELTLRENMTVSSLEKLKELVHNSVLEILKHSDNSLLNYSTLIFVGSNNNNIVTIENQNMAKNTSWWWKLMNIFK